MGHAECVPEAQYVIDIVGQSLFVWETEFVRDTEGVVLVLPVMVLLRHSVDEGELVKDAVGHAECVPEAQ